MKSCLLTGFALLAILILAVTFVHADPATSQPVVDPTPAMGASAYTLKTTAGIAATTTLIVMMLSALLNTKTWFGNLPIWFYAAVVASILCTIAVLSGWVVGDPIELVLQVVSSVIMSHGFSEVARGRVNTAIADVQPQLLTDWVKKSSNAMLLGLIVFGVGGCALFNANATPPQRLADLYYTRAAVGEQLVTLRKAGYIDDATAVEINNYIKASDVVLDQAERYLAAGDKINLESSLRKASDLIDQLIEAKAKAAAKKPKPVAFDPHERPSLWFRPCYA